MISSLAKLLFLLALLETCTLFAQDEPVHAKHSQPSASPNLLDAAISTIRPKAGILQPEGIADFEKNTPIIQQIFRTGLELSESQLNYKMGADDPASGGMDCSGAIFYTLQKAGIDKVPRSSDEQYRWTWQAHTFRAVNSTSAKGFEWSELRPGMLLFWTGTYNTGNRNPPISHVMIYLGKRKSDGRPIMFGASDGRSYEGRPRWGVGVFDFSLPATPGGKVRFVGYAEIPGIRDKNLSLQPVPQKSIE